MARIVGPRPSVTEKMKSGVLSTGKKRMDARVLREAGMASKEWMNSRSQYIGFSVDGPIFYEVCKDTVIKSISREKTMRERVK